MTHDGDLSEFEARHEQDCQRTYDLRRATWSAWGELDPDVLAPMINPAFMGAPRWPNLRRAYCASRRNGKVLLATDGLSDPFDSPEEPRHNGYDVEFYAISDDPALARYDVLTELLGTWLYDAVYQIGEYEASTGRIFAALEKSPVQHVFGLPGDGVPELYADTFRDPEDGSVCVLLNLTHTSVPSVLDGPLSPIHLINVKLLTTAEARLVIDEADSGRALLRQRFAEQPEPLVSTLDRASVV